MALHLRKRGEIWHARGTVRVGPEVIHVPSFSTGARTRADAEESVSRYEARIRQEHNEGPAGRAKRLIIADCLAAYLQRPGGVADYDKVRIAEFNEAIGHRLLSDAAPAWREWVALHPQHAPSTLKRAQNTLAAALRAGADAYATTAPKLPPVPQRRDAGLRVPILTPRERSALLAAYNPWAACPVLVMSEQGLRTQEALRMDWRDVNHADEEIRVPPEQSKSGRGRTVPMTRRTSLLLWGMWHAAGKPDSGPVFLSQRGKPYADTRGREEGQSQGGNPLAQAHATACRIAGVAAFRVHDLRHDWAARMLMGGMDLFTLCRLGGWASLRMVEERYGAVTARHMRDAVRRIG